MEFDKYRIRLIEIADLEQYYLLIKNNRKRLEDFFTGTVSKTNSLEETKLFLQENIEKSIKKSYFPFIIEQKETKEIIGYIDLKNIDWSIPKAEIGFYIDKNSSGKGIASEAFSIFVDYCFANYGFNKLFLRTHQLNVSAQRIAEKCGFEIEGSIRRDYKTSSGEIVDLIYYGRIN